MKIFSFVTKKFLIYAGILVVLVVLVIFGFRNGDDKQVATVVRGEIVQEVSATGKVKPLDSVSMGFDRTGRVGRVYVKVGDMVKTGQVLASLESGEASAEVAKARASLDQEIIKLREIKNTAPISFNDASKNLEAAIQEGFADADNAVRNKTDQFFKNVPDNPRFEVSITSGNFIHYFEVSHNIKIDLNNTRKKVEDILNNWQKRISNLNSSSVVSEADLAINDLRFISSFLDKVAGAVNSFVSTDYDYDTTVAGYKTAVNSARSEVSNAISALVTAKDKVNSSPLLGTTGEFESILSEETKVAGARAVLASAEANLRKFMIVSPFPGVVTLQEAKVGGTVTAGTSVISMNGYEGDVYIEADISEINIGKISEGNLVAVTFDAFPGEGKQGIVSYVEPGDFLIDGVVNYKIRIRLQPGDAEKRIKSGLTANLKIETARATDVLILPLYAISKESDGTYVNKIVGDKTVKIRVELSGLVSSNGLVRILSGLEVGDKVEF